jgi:hypothetical protein
MEVASKRWIEEQEAGRQWKDTLISRRDNDENERFHS